MLKTSLFSVWFYIKQLQYSRALYDCKEAFLVVPPGYVKRVLYYMIQRKFQLDVGRLVIVIIVTALNLYYTGPASTYVCNFSEIYSSIPPFPPVLNKFRIRNRSICWSRDRNCSSNMVCTYFRVWFLAGEGRRRGVPIVRYW